MLIFKFGHLVVSEQLRGELALSVMQPFNHPTSRIACEEVVNGN